MSYIDDAISKINSIKDVFGSNLFEDYKISTPYYTRITFATPRKKIHYFPSRGGKRWK